EGTRVHVGPPRNGAPNLPINSGARGGRPQKAPLALYSLYPRQADAARDPLGIIPAGRKVLAPEEWVARDTPQAGQTFHTGRSRGDGALDDGAELADVAGPVVPLQPPQRLGADAAHRPAVAGGERGDELVRQGGQDRQPLAQGRQVEADHVEAVEEVLAEA